MATNKGSNQDLVQRFKARLRRLEHRSDLLRSRLHEESKESVQANDEILDKLHELVKIKRQMDMLQEQLKEIAEKYQDILNMPELKELVENLEDRYYRFNTVYGEYVLKLQKGYERTTYAYADAVKTLLQTLPDKHKKILEKLLESTKKISTVADKLVLEKPKEIKSKEESAVRRRLTQREWERRMVEDSFLSRLWDKLVSAYESVVSFFQDMFGVIDDDLDTLEEYIELDMESMVES